MALAVWRVSGFRNAKSSAVMDWRRRSLPTTVGTGIPRRCSPEYSVKMKELGMRSWLKPSTRSKKRSRQLLRRSSPSVMARIPRALGSQRHCGSPRPRSRSGPLPAVSPQSVLDERRSASWISEGSRRGRHGTAVLNPDLSLHLSQFARSDGEAVVCCRLSPSPDFCRSQSLFSDSHSCEKRARATRSFSMSRIGRSWHRRKRKFPAIPPRPYGQRYSRYSARSGSRPSSTRPLTS